MMPPFVIAIEHGDKYFLLGLKYLLMNYFHRGKREVRFVDVTQHENADLIIVSEGWVRAVRPCLTHHRIRRVITIRDGCGSRREKRRICNTEVGSLGCNDGSDVLLKLVQLARTGKKDETESFRRCLCCTNALSRMERDVLRGVSQGLALATMARRFNVSVQTISRYKRNSMIKLGFSRDHELYKWFRLGGLENALELLSWR